MTVPERFARFFTDESWDAICVDMREMAGDRDGIRKKYNLTAFRYHQVYTYTRRHLPAMKQAGTRRCECGAKFEVDDIEDIKQRVCPECQWTLPRRNDHL